MLRIYNAPCVVYIWLWVQGADITFIIVSFMIQGIIL